MAAHACNGQVRVMLLWLTWILPLFDVHVARYHGMPTGMFGCDEHLAGNMPSRGTELCTYVVLISSSRVSFSVVVYVVGLLVLLLVVYVVGLVLGLLRPCSRTRSCSVCTVRLRTPTRLSASHTTRFPPRGPLPLTPAICGILIYDRQATYIHYTACLL